MNITSASFLASCVILVLIYYLVPKRFQWVVLLIASLLFYGMTGIRNMIYILITSGTTYLATLQIDKLAEKQALWLKENRKTADKETKSAYKSANKKARTAWLVGTLVINFGIMCTFKYLHFAIRQVNHIIHLWGGAGIKDTLVLIIPLGISFYTFQTMGYLADVYWERVKPERNYAKVLLFVSFFPQMTQGPISNFKDLTDELFKEHAFSYQNWSWGLQRMLWGLYKKLVVANILSIYVQDVFKNYSSYTGITTLIGAFCYSIQIYADFSGYMDIVCGLCQVMDIRLTENFDRPYFSKSIAEYWRRWHSSLGAWFKNYIYYPIAMAKWNQNIGKAARKKLGKTVGQTIPASIALVIVWLTTGLWHGASWAYIAWGGVNGLFIIAELWMEPVYQSWKTALHINENARLWKLFQVVRTFILVTFIKVLPEVGSLKKGIGLWKRIFTNYEMPVGFKGLLPFANNRIYFGAAVIGTLLILGADLIQRKQPVRAWLEKYIPYVVRIVFFALMAVAAVYFAYELSDLAGGFMYAQF